VATLNANRPVLKVRVDVSDALLSIVRRKFWRERSESLKDTLRNEELVKFI
jgi:hypothetical protein